MSPPAQRKSAIICPLSSAGREGESSKKSLADIEKEVLHELVGASSDYKGRQDELVRTVPGDPRSGFEGDAGDDELLAVLSKNPSTIADQILTYRRRCSVSLR